MMVNVRYRLKTKKSPAKYIAAAVFHFVDI